MTTLAALIERLEAAEAGSRELDREILWAWFPDERKAVFDGVRHISTMTGADGEFWFSPLESRDDCPHYSTSMDDALTLVPEGWGVMMSWPDLDLGGESVARVSETKNWESGVGVARTPALSLCIASLRARGARP